MTIAELILTKLKENGCHHVAGIPGTSCAGLFNAIDRDKEIDYILTTNELEAGYIADGYGRSGGFGAVCVSYGVGTLSLINAVASAFTERVPLVVINGGPTAEDLRIEKELGSLFSHSTGAEQTDLKVFTPVTVFAKVIKDTSDASEIINQAFDLAESESRPVYIQIPQNMWDNQVTKSENEKSPTTSKLNPAFKKRAQEALSKSKSPVLFVGVEIVRRNLHNEVLSLIEKWNIPFVTTALAKSFISESHPLFVGCYDSDLFHAKGQFKIIDNSDCPIGLGCIWGIDHRAFIKAKHENMIDVSFSYGRISKEKFSEVDLESVIDDFLSSSFYFDSIIPQSENCVSEGSSDYFGHDQVFESVNQRLKNLQNVQVVMDTCLGSFPGADLVMPFRNMYLANPIWLSIGQGTPAAIGAYFKNKKLPIIITGDGGFQMVAQSYSTMVKYKVPALILILDNSLYAIEQYLIDPSYFTSENPPLRYVQLNNWSYESFPKVFKGGTGKRAKSKDQLDSIINAWMKSEKNQPWIVACEIPLRDLPSN